MYRITSSRKVKSQRVGKRKEIRGGFVLRRFDNNNKTKTAESRDWSLAALSLCTSNNFTGGCWGQWKKGRLANTLLLTFSSLIPSQHFFKGVTADRLLLYPSLLRSESPSHPPPHKHTHTQPIPCPSSAAALVKLQPELLLSLAVGIVAEGHWEKKTAKNKCYSLAWVSWVSSCWCCCVYWLWPCTSRPPLVSVQTFLLYFSIIFSPLTQTHSATWNMLYGNIMSWSWGTFIPC